MSAELTLARLTAVLRDGQRNGAAVVDIARLLEWLRRNDIGGVPTPLPTVVQVAPSAPEDPIGTRAAAEMLGCSPRRVRQLAAGIGGIRVGWFWQLPRAGVQAEAKRRRDVGQRNGGAARAAGGLDAG